MSQDPKPSGSGVQTENEKLKRKIQMLEEKNSQLELLATEQEPEQKRAKIFQDFQLEEETLLKSAKRRLKYQHNKNPKKILDTVKKIVSEAEISLSYFPEIKEIMLELSGGQWPLQVTSCLDFNTGGCVRQFCHTEVGRIKKEEFLRLHVCSICMEMFRVAIFHQGLDCQTLRLIDEKLEQEKHQSLLKSRHDFSQSSQKN